MTDGELLIRPRLDQIGSERLLHTEADPSKLYIRSSNGKYMGGDYRDGWVSGRIRELGQTYELDYDDEAPSVTPYSIGRQIMLNVSDKQSGVASITATIDGQFVVFDTREKSTLVVCDLSETPVRKTGGEHRLQFLATDHCNNTATYETNIIY